MAKTFGASKCHVASVGLRPPRVQRDRLQEAENVALHELRFPPCKAYATCNVDLAILLPPGVVTCPASAHSTHPRHLLVVDVKGSI